MSQYRSIRIRTRFQTGQSASYHKQRQNKEVETVDSASRYEHQGTDTEENQSRYHSPPVAPLPDNPSGRQRHQKVGTIDSSLRQGRHRLADMERLLEMRIQHLQDAMSKAPHKEETADDEEGHQIVMPFVSVPSESSPDGLPGNGGSSHPAYSLSSPARSCCHNNDAPDREHRYR